MKKKSDEIKSAIDRLKKAKVKIDANHSKSKAKEPKSLISGKFDELELKRQQKYGDEDD